MVPELIFGELLTGTNFNDELKRTVGGRNGYGAKLANIYSDEFELEIVDINLNEEGKQRNLKFKQLYTENMSTKHKAKISKLSEQKNGYVKIRFKPDLKRFDLNELTDDNINL